VVAADVDAGQQLGLPLELGAVGMLAQQTGGADRTQPRQAARAVVHERPDQGLVARHDQLVPRLGVRVLPDKLVELLLQGVAAGPDQRDNRLEAGVEVAAPQAA